MISSTQMFVKLSKTLTNYLDKQDFDFYDTFTFSRYPLSGEEIIYYQIQTSAVKLDYYQKSITLRITSPIDGQFSLLLMVDNDLSEKIVVGSWTDDFSKVLTKNTVDKQHYRIVYRKPLTVHKGKDYP